MAFDVAEQAIRFLEQEITAEVDRSEKGAAAYADANLTEPSHIRKIILSDAKFLPGENSIAFKGFLELGDNNDNQYEAEVEGTCERLPGGGSGWKKTGLKVLDAGPLPMGG